MLATGFIEFLHCCYKQRNHIIFIYIYFLAHDLNQGNTNLNDAIDNFR